MQRIPFRDFHLLALLDEWEKEAALPLDLAVCRYLRLHPALGSKDRAELVETLYTLVRWRVTLEYLLPGSSWQEKLRMWRDHGGMACMLSERLRSGYSLPPRIEVCFPQLLYERICASHGEEKGRLLCLVSNEPAPTCVRVNTLKISREELLNRWDGTYDVLPTLHSESGILFRHKVHFYSMSEFRQGWFEVQDEGSQLVASLVKPELGEIVLDYCAGAGGKALAIATRMGGRGQLYLHDVRSHALVEAKRRLKRAGVQNGQVILAGAPHLKKLKKKVDWVLVDAPCSGTGTLRRNPDMKQRFDQSLLDRLSGQQRMIFERALSFVKPGGHIVYATCSLLREENEAQLEHFSKLYGVQWVEPPFISLPSSGEMDGFFAVTLKVGDTISQE